MTSETLLKIEQATDHTLLKADMTATDLETFIHNAKGSQVASLCIPPAFISQAKKLLGEENIPLCTVISFPNGYATTASKVAETKDALGLGADEIDLVAPIGLIKGGELNKVREQVLAVREHCQGHILKVILESGALTIEELLGVLEALNDSGIDFYKTSTGYNFPGASPETVRLIAEHKNPEIRIKASGGIRSLEDAQKYLELGADRLGASALLQAIRDEREKRHD